jgi:hypothetical protein
MSRHLVIPVFFIRTPLLYSFDFSHFFLGLASQIYLCILLKCFFVSIVYMYSIHPVLPERNKIFVKGTVSRDGLYVYGWIQFS